MKESRLTTLIIFLILNSLCIKGASTEFPQRGEYFFMLQISDEALVEIFAKNLLISRVEDKCVIFYCLLLISLYSYTFKFTNCSIS